MVHELVKNNNKLNIIISILRITLNLLQLGISQNHNVIPFYF